MITATIIAGLSLAGIYVIVFWLFRSYQVDAFREELFVLRDEWFDFAHKGGIPFDHPVYGSLRTTMNGYIQFSHRLGFSTLGLVAVMTPEERAWMADYARGVLDVPITDLDDSVRKAVRRFRQRMSHLVARHIFLSPLGVVTVFPALIFFLVLRRKTTWARQLWGMWNRNIDVTAVAQLHTRIAHY